MINIWNYANDLPRVILTGIDGSEYIGKVLAVLDAEETEDLEDYIDLRLDSGEIKSFYPSEIKSIDVIR